MFKQFSKETLIYGSGQVVVQVIGLVLFPLFTNPDYFSPSEFGQWNILYISLTIFTIIFAGGLTTGFFKYFSFASDTREKNEVITASLVAVTLISLVCSTIFMLIVKDIIPAINKELSWEYYPVIMGTALLSSYLAICTAILRADRNPTHFIRIQIIRFMLLLLLSFTFIILLDAKLWGIVFAFLIAVALTLVYGFITVLSKFSFDLKSDVVRKLVRFSFPLMPTQLAGWVLSVSDRLIIGYILGNAAVGQYSTGYTLGMVMNGLVIGPFSLAWGPFMFKQGIKPDGGKIIGDLLLKFTGIAGLIALGISLFSKEALAIITSEPSYSDVWMIAPWVSFGYIFYAYYLFYTTGFNIQGKTTRLPWVTLGVSGFSIAMNFFLLPKYGIMASAILTAVSYFLLFFILKLWSAPSYRIVIDYSKLALIWIVFGISLSLGIYCSMHCSMLLALFVKTLALLGAMVLIILVLDLIPRAQKQHSA